MQVNTFFVPLGDTGEAQEKLNVFLRGHRILQIDKVFEGRGWAICVEWLEGENESEYWRHRPRVDWKEKLEPAAFDRFAKLRERRKEIAAEDGVPPYMVMTDAQMAEAAKAEVLTAKVLQQIDGFGEAKMKKYSLRLVGDVT